MDPISVKVGILGQTSKLPGDSRYAQVRELFFYAGAGSGFFRGSLRINPGTATPVSFSKILKPATNAPAGDDITRPGYSPA